MQNDSNIRRNFALIKSQVNRFALDYQLPKPEHGFIYFILSHILNLQDHEIDDSITDTDYVQNKGNRGHDRGIDAVYFDYTPDKSTCKIHLFNLKYALEINTAKKSFPANEIDKILGFISAVMQDDKNLKNEINPVLYSKVEEMWQTYDDGILPTFVLHVCANYERGFDPTDAQRLERGIAKYSDFFVEYHTIHDLAELVVGRSKSIVNARLTAIDNNLFEKTDGDIRAIIVNVEAYELIRIVIDDDTVRDDVSIDVESLGKYDICEDAFEENVRVYIGQRTQVNRNIKHTALSSENHRFFYFNNGVTITCVSYSYPKNKRAPIIQLNNLQVVNGSQTIHALHQALQEDFQALKNVEILLRIYEIKNPDLKVKIAEYTNSQNPVKSRDIRSIDVIQQKLEIELDSIGYYYERKKNLHSTQPRNKRIDAEKAGQAILAFYNKRPTEAKNAKRIIFGDEYDNIFNDSLTGELLLLAYKLFEEIESRKKSARTHLDASSNTYEDDSFFLFASYYVLYIMGELARTRNIDLIYNNYDKILVLYDDSLKVIRTLIKYEKEAIRSEGKSADTYSHTAFFKTTRPKTLFENHRSQFT